MLICALLAIVIVIVLAAIITGVAGYLVQFKTGWLDTAFSWLVGILTGVGGWFMLPALTVLVGGIFQEAVFYRVENTFYPDSVRNEARGFWPDLMHDILFTGKAVFLNLLVLPLYFFGIGFVISIGLNSYLL